MVQNIAFRAEFFREVDLYVGLAPELNVSSFGETLDEAKRSLVGSGGSFHRRVRDDGNLRGSNGGSRVYKEGRQLASSATGGS